MQDSIRLQKNLQASSLSCRRSTAAVRLRRPTGYVPARNAPHADIQHGQIDERFLMDVAAALGIPVLDTDHRQVNLAEVRDIKNVPIGPSGELAGDALDQRKFRALHQV